MIADSLDLSSFSLGGSRFVTLSSSLAIDWCNHKGQPSRGGIEKATVMYAVGTGSSDGLSYWGVRVDLRQYFHLFRKRTLSARLLVEAVDVLDGAKLPNRPQDVSGY